MSSGHSRDLSPIFEPKSIAVIGASNNPTKWGWIIPSNILSNGYVGKIYPVNPKGEEILGLKSYPSLLNVPGDVDLAIIVRPAPSVPQHLEECVEKGVKAAIVISGGFRETGEEGERLEREAVRIARRGGVLLVGPNTMGVWSSTVSLSALMPPVVPRSGAVALISQSGNIGTNALAFGSERGIGFSKFVSSGNEADIATEEYLDYFFRDPQTRVILAYIEGLRDGRRFIEVAKRVTKKKPIIIYKAGRTSEGARAARSHSGALSGSNRIYDAAFKQCGVLKASTVNELLDLAAAFLLLPLPRGKRVGILTWGGGYGVVATDACVEAGLEVPTLPVETIRELDGYLPPYWSRGNPVDLVGTFDRSIQPKCLEALVRAENIDSVIASGLIVGRESFGAALTNSQRSDKLGERVADDWLLTADRKNMDTMAELIERYGKPIVAVTLTTRAQLTREAFERKVAAYSSLEGAANVLVKMLEYANFLRCRGAET